MSSKIIKFGEQGYERRFKKHCRHKNITYDPQGRTIECEDCKSFLDPFTTFLQLVNQYEGAWEQLEREKTAFSELKEKDLSLIVAKQFEKLQRSRHYVPGCPHCGEAIFTQDRFKRVDRDRAKERRRFKDKTTNGDKQG